MLKYDEKSMSAIVKSRVPDDADFPRVILLDTVSYCNLKCSICSHKNMTRKQGFMQEGLYKKLIDEIAENEPNAQIWITFFGEGMILKDLPEKIAYSVKKGVPNIMLNSNGALYTKEYGERLIKCGLKKLLVGIDAVTEETYNKIRIGGDFDRVVNGVLEYKNMLNEFGAPGQEVVVQFVETYLNINEVEDFIRFWNSHDIQCKIRPMVSWAGKVEAKNQVDAFERLPCYWAMNAFNVIDDGRVPLCTCDLDCEYSMGDVVSHSIKDIWNGNVKKFRDMHRYGKWDDLPEVCSKCKDWQSGYAQYE